MAKEDNKHSRTFAQVVGASFSNGIGALLALVATVAVLAVISYVVALSHDFLTSRNYDRTPAISSNNAFGPLLVSVTITSQDKVDAIPAHTVSCYAPPPTTGRINWLGDGFASQPGYAGQDTSSPSCTFTASAFAGTGEIDGTVIIKNRLWLRSIRISGDLLKAQFGNTITSTAGTDTSTSSLLLKSQYGISFIVAPASGLDGVILKPGQSMVSNFKATFGAGEDGQVVLSANGKNYILR